MAGPARKLGALQAERSGCREQVSGNRITRPRRLIRMTHRHRSHSTPAHAFKIRRQTFKKLVVRSSTDPVAFRLIHHGVMSQELQSYGGTVAHRHRCDGCRLSADAIGARRHGHGIQIRKRRRTTGDDVMGNRIATVGGIVAGGCSWVAAVTGRMVLPIVLVFIASAPFALLSLVALQLAF